MALVDHGCKIWFTVVPTASPTLLGLDYINHAQASLDPEGYLRYKDGHLELLKKLRSGHWGLCLI